MICDMHTHSVFSDGTYTPKEIIDTAIASGLSAVALTDHNTVDGLPDFIAAAQNKNIEVVLGCEFSVDHCGKELHLLGLFIKPEYFGQITEMMQKLMSLKELSNIDLINSLSAAGFDLNYEEIKNSTPNGKINRAHIAEAMQKRGYVNSIAEAFETYLSKSGGHYKEPPHLSVFETIDFINSIGAVSVLAHPFLNLSEEELKHFLPEAKSRGLIGMECYYSLYDETTTRLSLQIAKDFGLLCSGGSDFHGSRKPDISLGVGKGNLKIPYEWYLELKGKAK
ncbi:MAG: PHP domain-containing protein [Clostridia bacterium]|nr:PHP domain-containing protein [Clostridia bacterium]